MLQKSKIYFLLLCFLGMLFLPLIPIEAIRDIQVVVKPRRIETRATYLITLKLDTALQVHDWIKVIWPKETKLPILPEDPIERNLELKRIIESIFIGTSPCSACQGYPEINYKENSIRFNIHLELNPAIHGYEKINITITDRVGIINPPKPGMYELKIATAKEQSSAKSIPYEIVESRLGEPEGKPVVSVVPNGNHARGEYKIECNVGTGGALVFNQSRIRIQFPNEILLSKKPHEIEPFNIKLNDKPVMNKIMIADQILTFISPINTENSEKLKIVIEKGVGVINPDVPGHYLIKVSTSEDPDWVDSNLFLIEQNYESLTVDPNKANRYASYKFQFLTNQKMEAIDPINIQFPATVFLPSQIDVSKILVNLQPVKAISIKENSILLYLKEVIPVNTLLAVDFTSSSLIKNPAESGFIKLGYKISDQEVFSYTTEVWIEKTVFSIQSIQVEPPNASANASYRFQLLIDLNSGIPRNESVYILFPMGSQIPENLSKKDILLNDLEVLEVKKLDSNTISITNPAEVFFDQVINIIIEKSSGIQNPSIGNEMVQFVLFCSLDQTIKVKKEIFLYPQLPKTEILFTSGTKGENDWFIKAPILDFRVNQEGCKTFFFWNGIEENILDFSEAKVLPDGQYQTIISFYSESPYGKESIQTVSIKVDTIKPELLIKNPADKIIKTNQDHIVFEGIAKPHDFSFKGETIQVFDKKLQINGEVFPIIKDQGEFTIVYPILPTIVTIQISLEDEAGNSDQEEFQIDYKNQKPSCKIINPINEDWILKKDLIIQGQTDPFSLAECKETKTEADLNGFFILTISLSDPGLKYLSVKITDLYGNKEDFPLTVWYGFSIRMQINSLQASNNNKKRTMDLAPFIRDSRTMVPFRFLGEELQAKISFEKDPITKLVNKIQYELQETVVLLSIGDLKASVNGVEIQLDSPPIIIRGRTVVPLRFITENLGCKTMWEPNSKSIQVFYAP
jgi:hypothetical protein